MLGEMLLSKNHPMTYYDVTQSIIDEHSGKKVVTSLQQFNLIDKNLNGAIDYHEIMTASSYDVHKFFKYSKIGSLTLFISTCALARFYYSLNSNNLNSYKIQVFIYQK